MAKYRITLENIHDDGTTETKSWEGHKALICIYDETGTNGCIQSLSILDIAEILANDETLSTAALIAAGMNVKDRIKEMHPTEE